MSEVDFSGCAAIGVYGYHSEEYGDEGGQCNWCGARPPSLDAERTKLCDLLLGRFLRNRALVVLETAIEIETVTRRESLCGQPASNDYRINEYLDRACHIEWIASITEQGKVLWGRRHNRCGSELEAAP